MLVLHVDDPMRAGSLWLPVAEQGPVRGEPEDPGDRDLRLVPFEDQDATILQDTEAFREHGGQIRLPCLTVETTVLARHVARLPPHHAGAGDPTPPCGTSRRETAGHDSPSSCRV